MICTCNNCHYTFESATLPSRCPDCGKIHFLSPTGANLPAVREATEGEIKEYREIQRKIEKEQI